MINVVFSMHGPIDAIAPSHPMNHCKHFKLFSNSNCSDVVLVDDSLRNWIVNWSLKSFIAEIMNELEPEKQIASKMQTLFLLL